MPIRGQFTSSSTTTDRRAPSADRTSKIPSPRRRTWVAVTGTYWDRPPDLLGSGVWGQYVEWGHQILSFVVGFDFFFRIEIFEIMGFSHCLDKADFSWQLVGDWIFLLLFKSLWFHEMWWVSSCIISVFIPFVMMVLHDFPMFTVWAGATQSWCSDRPRFGTAPEVWPGGVGSAWRRNWQGAKWWPWSTHLLYIAIKTS